MAIPLKFRGGVDAVAATGTTPERAAVPAQVENNISFALAPGFKHSWITYRGSKNSLGLNTTTLSTSLGALVGLGVVEVSDKTTQNRITAAQTSKNAIIPVGGHVVFGYNTLNIGLAGGVDIITGPNKEAWIYKGKGWLGVIVGLDLIK
jgi:hypothetical protein